MLSAIIRTAGMTNWKKFAISVFFCPLCGGKRAFVRLDTNEISIRCLFCRATTITLSLVAVLRHVSPDLGSKSVFELSSRGPLFRYLKQKTKSLTYSEYFSDISPGEYKEGVQCQDVQRLTYQSESFDICTSTEVFEHVPMDKIGFSEIYRVLNPNGILVFTVPLDIHNITVERAELVVGGGVKHFLPSEYHRDPLRKDEPILTFRNYGYDILDKLLNAGFKRAEIRRPGLNMPWGYTRPVIVAYRKKASNERLNSDPLLLRSASH
ncbi:MAG: class I SAM-dependent methyltransferase [Thermodesulfobacteriota bacterium]|nr:class I SAM-dependent methyltransferase [Thermodesulfobacteriota bacterium]